MFYLNPKWFSGRLLRNAHPLFKSSGIALEIALLGDLERPGQSITNILRLVVKLFIFNSQSVDSIRLDRLKLYVKHHSIVERYTVEVGSLHTLTLESLLKLIFQPIQKCLVNKL